MKHTPGPWYASSPGIYQGLVISEKTGANIAITYNKNDAAIVAAAPDMLEELYRALPFLEVIRDDPGYKKGVVSARIRAINDAIAKAEAHQ